MEIGRFKKTDDGFEGRLRTLGLDLPVRLVASGSAAGGKAPDWRVISVGADDRDMAGRPVGAGWTHSRKDGNSFLALRFDCPTLARPLHANLVLSNEQADLYLLLWTRPRSPRAAEGSQ
ncbi:MULTISPECIES: DUF736 domain-containing protein [unclassified Novosphingobium]|uniref:DUF736 domain-containing protein n=1 Tax=unclassified Novosphingobium TaxID=2644732 RepID=UPI00146C7641|nr:MULTISPECIES: DUF736 domain-containing protein [unclassified Novosphingobium]NMN03837.1 uncharacterized protein (DUF736 family) [Novosphingobium sp. SG919]NMN86173.1 uncharacterized protein (DUF736 family) [Novosphingobium sp. SG916]